MSTVAILFAGLNERRVPELTGDRTMASVPFGCRYRLIDFTLSNVVNAGITKVGVLAHYNYQSLMEHLGTGKDWDLARRNGGIKILPPFITAFANRGNALYASRLEALISARQFINECKEDCEKKVAELNATLEVVTAEKNEAIANSEKIQAALDECIKERDQKCQELDQLWEEMKVLREELGKAKAKERIGELNAALADYSDEEKAYAQAEIDAFNANPIESEINSVVDKILIGIGKKAKETSVTNEQNSAKTDIEDIFSGVDASTPAEDKDIFN